MNIGPEISIAAELLEFQRHYGGEIKVSSIKDKLVFDRVALITSEREFWEELLRLEETIGTRFGYSAMRIPFNASGTQRPVHH
ncbi:MAG TPA: hypothetical protein VEA92_01375 [Candidatus Paceibacterota bacterium]|nr:hypothetical protein [Candidatus Paceibacterota bacterium]